MTNDELEQYLTRFGVANPPDVLREAVLRTARRRQLYSDALKGWAIAAAAVVVCGIQVWTAGESRERRLRATIDIANADERAVAALVGPEAARNLALSRLLASEQERREIRDGIRSQTPTQAPAEQLLW
jgi:hypothetical protein